MEKNTTVPERFDPKVHLAKFYFEQWTMWREPYLKKISGNLYTNELTIEIRNFQGEIVDVFGYSLKDRISTLLTLVHWEDFEKLRDVVDWESPYERGYRDGWGYRFVCMNESGHPMISRVLQVVFEKGHEPADERLLQWIKNGYAYRKELKQYGSLW